MTGEYRRTVLVEVRCVVCDRVHPVNLRLEGTQIDVLRAAGLAMHDTRDADFARPLGCEGCQRYTTRSQPPTQEEGGE